MAKSEAVKRCQPPNVYYDVLKAATMQYHEVAQEGKPPPDLDQ